MIKAQTQVHGYQQGHQLLDSSCTLPKADQSIVDRLSDMAGPLRPGEVFDPYLSAYPLPSEQFYVLARTWQDNTVSRAGCVRTLSLIIPVEEWQNARSLQHFLDFLDPEKFPSTAQAVELHESQDSHLPQTPEFRANELLEALFFEDSKPVVLFDAPAPELIGARLLTAFWPALRRRFSLSTFALSPRKIEGRNFDLVFAPKDVRARFSDWPGRRVDALAGTAARHRWTGEIVERVFRSPSPWLLADSDIRQIGDEGRGSPSALRIALLWDELLDKLERSPSAVLGLLDIANSQMHRHSTAMHDLQPVLAIAARRAVETMPALEAWEFLGAMVRKIIGTPLTPALSSLTSAIGELAGQSPSGAIALLDHLTRPDVIDAMVEPIADGFVAHFDSAAERALVEARSPTFKRLIVANKQLARASLVNPDLVERIAQVIGSLESETFTALQNELVPSLVDDSHAVLARMLFPSLGVDGLVAQAGRISKRNGFQAEDLLPPLVERARQIGAFLALRDVLVTTAPSPGRDNFLRMTLSPTAQDAKWILEQTGLGDDTTDALLRDIIGRATPVQFRDLLADSFVGQMLLQHFVHDREILLRAVTEGQLALPLRTRLVLGLLPKSPKLERRRLATDLLENCLRAHFGGDEIDTISALFEVLGDALDGERVARIGLNHSLTLSVAKRNIVAFNKSPEDARERILDAIEEVAEGINGLLPGLDREAATACADLLWDARSVNLTGLLLAAGRLLPTLFRTVQAPVSAIVAATFPLVYRELAKEDDVPTLLKFVPFVDWDRCKAARRELVDQFLLSQTWEPSDLALAACRSLDVDTILERVVKAHGGEVYIKLIAKDLKRLPSSCRDEVKKSIKRV